MTADKIYTALCTLFVVLIIIGNLIYQKFVFLPLPFHTFELSVGAILYPLTFLITDLIAEFYGKKQTNFCVRLAIIMNIVVVLIISLMDKLNATKWSKIDNITFHNIFGLYNISFLGSIIACYTAQFIDIRIYLWIRALTHGKWLWLRNNVSTAISLFIDTFIVISFMSVFGVLPIEQIGGLIINSYLYKFLFAIFSTPLFYIEVGIIRKIINA